MDTQNKRDLAIRELRLLVKKYEDAVEPPRAIGGTYSLSPQEMLNEVENDTEIGRKIVEAFNSLRKNFPER